MLEHARKWYLEAQKMNWRSRRLNIKLIIQNKRKRKPYKVSNCNVDILIDVATMSWICLEIIFYQASSLFRSNFEPIVGVFPKLYEYMHLMCGGAIWPSFWGIFHDQKCQVWPFPLPLTTLLLYFFLIISHAYKGNYHKKLTWYNFFKLINFLYFWWFIRARGCFC